MSRTDTDTPTRMRALGDGSAELAYRSFPGDGIVLVFLPGATALLVAEVTKIGSSVSTPVFALPVPDGFPRFGPYAEEIRAAAVEFYQETTPNLAAFFRARQGGST